MLPTISTIDAPAMCWACCRSPRPSAREVMALTPIAKPIDSDTIKNSSVPA